MTGDAQDRLEEIYGAALRVEPDRRPEFVRQACGEDAVMRSEIESLLAYEMQIGSFLEEPPIGTVAEMITQGSLVGQTLGPYEVESLLGTGGMGTVYRARDTRLGRAVAIKLTDTRFGARSLIEARAVAALNHPHVCTLYDVGPNYLVMELVEGHTVAQLLRKGPFPVQRILQYGIEISDALMAAHEQRIIHRDLKPGNIMIARGRAKVLDFGLAKLPAVPVHPTEMDTAGTDRDHLTGAGLIVGTAAYMSPEQARGEELDERTDLFSLGVVLYEMATGRAPFQGTNKASVIDAVLQQTPPPPSRLNAELPLKLQQIIHKALEKDRELRYQHAVNLRADLKRMKRTMADRRQVSRSRFMAERLGW